MGAAPVAPVVIVPAMLPVCAETTCAHARVPRIPRASIRPIALPFFVFVDRHHGADGLVIRPLHRKSGVSDDEHGTLSICRRPDRLVIKGERSVLHITPWECSALQSLAAGLSTAQLAIALG